MNAYFRQATESDCDLLYEWANDKTVRAGSFCSEPIPYEGHCRWFANVLASKEIIQLIYMVDNDPVGQVRLTVEGDKAELGYSICSRYRMQGQGKRMLGLLPEYIRENYPEIKAITAKVKPENAASHRNLLAVGYVKQYEEYELDVRAFEK